MVKGITKFFLIACILALIATIILIFIKPWSTENKKIIYGPEIFLNKPSVPESHQAFILKLIPLIQKANLIVLEERKVLKEIYNKVKTGKKITQHEKNQLKKLESKYRGSIKKNLFQKKKSIILLYLSELISRADIVPIRLALAQAAIESGWGQSRFCLEGNAYFGIHCYKSGCGIKAKADTEGGFEVKAYENVQESVDDYILFLNSKRGMQSFRNERLKYFHADEIPDLSKLAASIKGYSAIGNSYHEMIQSLFKSYIPEQIENY